MQTCFMIMPNQACDDSRLCHHSSFRHGCVYLLATEIIVSWSGPINQKSTFDKPVICLPYLMWLCLPYVLITHSSGRPARKTTIWVQELKSIVSQYYSWHSCTLYLLPQKLWVTRSAFSDRPCTVYDTSWGKLIMWCCGPTATKCPQLLQDTRSALLWFGGLLVTDLAYS